MQLPKIVILGQPNVGKSSLFNRLLRQNVAITSDISGTTRDFKKNTVTKKDDEGNHHHIYEIIDTAGLDKANVFSKEFEQIGLDMATQADVILYMVDGKSIALDLDCKLFFALAKLHKPLALVVNKIDNDKEKDNLWDFNRFGTTTVFATSIAHNRGISKLQNWIDEQINTHHHLENQLHLQQTLNDALELESTSKASVTDDQKTPINIGIIGRVNVGKSSILNALVGYKRSIVSDIAGTTLDPVDEQIDFADHRFNFIDTAGIRRKGKILGLEKYALMRTRKLLAQSNICLLILDATEPMNRLDEKICALIDEFNLGVIVVFNKWDETIFDFDKLKKEFKHRFKFLEYAPILTASALSLRNIDKLKQKIVDIYTKYSYRIATSQLNEIIKEATINHPVPRKNHKGVKIYYATQFQSCPPQISIITNKDNALHFSYQRYLKNCIRAKIDLEGTPIILEVKKRSSSKQKEDSTSDIH